MRGVIKSTSLSSDELLTFVMRAEAIVNSRSISAVYDDAREPQPLSPSDFVLGRISFSFVSNDLSCEALNRNQFIKLLDSKQKCVSELWRRWRMEYLRFLRISSKYHSSCLLYTSPSPRDRQKSRMPSSA